MAKYMCKKTGKIREIIQFEQSWLCLKNIKKTFFNHLPQIEYSAVTGILKAGDDSIAISVGDLLTIEDGKMAFFNPDFIEKYLVLIEVGGMPMSTNDQIAAFTGDLWKVVERYMDEFELPLAGAIGALELIKDELIRGVHEKDS